MAINRVDFPTTPNPISGDWSKIVELVSKSYQNINNPLQVDGSNIPQGSTFQVGGVIYYADADTAITGTASSYVKLAPNGSVLEPSFVADLTGVTWNKIWNGYYDTNGNLYIFDEVKAILTGTLSGSKSKFSELWNEHIGQNLKPTDGVTFATVNTGQGDNELYAMNQNVRTTDGVTFATVNTGYGNNEIYPTTVIGRYTNYSYSNATFYLPTLALKRLAHYSVALANLDSSSHTITLKLPSGGTYAYSAIIGVNATVTEITAGSASVSGGSTIASKSLSQYQNLSVHIAYQKLS